MNNPFDPKKYGAVTKSDTSAFLIGAAIGGIADAALNVLGFVEPFMAASLAGTGMLGLKRTLWDGTGHFGIAKRREFAELELEAADYEMAGNKEEAERIRSLVETGRERGLLPDQIRSVLDKRRRAPKSQQGSKRGNGNRNRPANRQGNKQAIPTSPRKGRVKAGTSKAASIDAVLASRAAT
jgi:hypothetical protein